VSGVWIIMWSPEVFKSKSHDYNVLRTGFAAKIGRTSVIYLHIYAICYQNLLNIIDQCCRTCHIFLPKFHQNIRIIS
jgi:hypothetical protein